MTSFIEYSIFLSILGLSQLCKLYYKMHSQDSFQVFISMLILSEYRLYYDKTFISILINLNPMEIKQDIIFINIMLINRKIVFE